MNFSCPVYKVVIDGSGIVLFEGKERVSAKGLHTRKIRPSVVEELGQHFAATGYFNFPDVGACSDGAMVITSLTLGTSTHEVRDRCSSPELTQVEDEIDRVSNSKVWVRGRVRLWLNSASIPFTTLGHALQSIFEPCRCTLRH